MKKISIIIAISIFILGCGKEGEVGPKGSVGANGADGAKGATGDKGPIGTTGVTGDAGKDVAVAVYFSDWVSVKNFELLGDNGATISFESENDYIPKIIPNYSKTDLTLFEGLDEFYVYDETTKVLLGSLFTFNSFVDVDGKRLIFRNRFEDTRKSFSNSALGLFDFEGNDVVPSISETNVVTHKKSSYPANTDFISINKALDAKTRHVFIPVGLPQKSGRLKKLETYQDFVEAYGIPE